VAVIRFEDGIVARVGEPAAKLFAIEDPQLVIKDLPVSSVKGAKRILVKNAVAHLPPRFNIAELEKVCKGISRRTLVRALEDLRGEGSVRCLGRGPDAQWERIDR